MRVLIAPDHFGGTLTAVQAAEVMADPWRSGGHEVGLAPMSDGGTGLIESVHATHGGSLISVKVPGALGDPVPAAVLHVPGAAGGSAFIEGAAVLGSPPPARTSGTGDTGLVQGPTPDEAARPDSQTLAEHGSSAGLAELLHAALETGARRVVIGLGASATHDAGAGLLSRLSVRTGGAAQPEDQPWQALQHLRRHLAGTDLVVAAAQDAPLLGLHGAGAGLQQFGLSPWQTQRIETQTSQYAHEALSHARSLAPVRPLLGGNQEVIEPGTAHTGAGGGAAFALGLLGARLLPGSLVVGEQVRLRHLLQNSDLVLTGAHTLDADTLYQGVVAAVGSQAATEGLPVVALARAVTVSSRELAKAGISAGFPLINQPLVPGNRRADPVDPVRALAMRSARVMRHWART